MEFSIKTAEIGLNDITIRNLKEDVIKIFEDLMGKDYYFMEQIAKQLEKFYSHKYKFDTKKWKIIKEKQSDK